MFFYNKVINTLAYQAMKQKPNIFTNYPFFVRLRANLIFGEYLFTILIIYVIKVFLIFIEDI